MNLITKSLKTIGIFTLVFALFNSCSEDANPIGTDQELAPTELQTILTTDEAAGTVDNALAELFAGSAQAGKSAKSANDCYSAEYTDTGFVATFNNCVLNGTENVNGTLTVTYEVGNETAAFTATYEDFYVGTIKLNGTRAYQLDSNVQQNTISFTVTSNMTVEMEDESVITETGTKTFAFTFGENLGDSSFSLSGNWTVTADGNTYAIETVDPLEVGFNCEHLTSGSMNVSKNGLEVIVDFGDGECDEVATLTYPDGTTEEINL